MKAKAIPNIYKQVQRLADVTNWLIQKGNIKKARRYLQITEDIFNKGTSEVKNAISNIYVFSVSSFMEIQHCMFTNLFPESLHSEYQKQIHASGI
ncbi:MAG: hypothetical protein IPO16_11915 [Saprospiraceae bacterium]|nr:hypothetical protein [Saprospiraceae bacterium]